MEDRIQTQHDWLRWGFGFLLWLQEYSNRGLKWTAGSASCISWLDKGNFVILSTTGKRRKPHKPQGSGLTGPNQESSQEGPCDPTRGSPQWPLQFLDTEQEYKRIPYFISKGKLNVQTEISQGKRTTKEVLRPLHLQWESAFCVHQSWNLLRTITTKHQRQGLFWQETRGKIFYQ